MPVFNTIPPETQEKLIIMASTDIRSMLANLEAATAQGTQNAATIATQGVTLADVKATAVVEKDFTLQKAAFALEGDVYRALIQHDMGSKFPGVTIYDNGGDLQLAEFIALDTMKCKLELTAIQWADNDFPLTVNLQARSSATVAGPIGMSGYAVPGTEFKVRYNAAEMKVERSTDNFVNRANINDSANIAEAKIAPDGQIHVRTADNFYFYSLINNGSWQASNSGNFDGLTVANGAIVL
jgi:hypothetical protein